MTVAELAQQFETEILRSEMLLQAAGEDAAGVEVKAGGWTRKEELGHLLDSAQNNHQRFVVAIVDGRFEGPGYAQDQWVECHGYSGMTWAELLGLWTMRNRMLHRIVARMPEERLGAAVLVGTNPQMTLEELIVDYLRHLRHHVERIAGLEDL